jgi:hypothetical protein
MNSIEQQIELNEECKLALSDNCNGETWLEKYHTLYKRCSIKPQGRPSISLAFHDGVFFEEIDEFVTRYSNLIEPIKQWTDEDYLNLANDE